MTVFSWSVWNGANYYMEVFGKRFQKELEQMKRDVAKWQNSPGDMFSPPIGPSDADGKTQDGGHSKRNSIDRIPLLDETKSGSVESAKATGASILSDADGSLVDRKGVTAPES